MKKILLALALAMLPFGAWAAPQSSGTVVTTCGTLATPYLAGRDGPLTVDTTGVLCSSSSGGGGGGTSSSFSAAFPATGTAIGVKNGANMVNLTADSAGNLNSNIAAINGVVPLMGNGVTGTGSQRVTIASDNTPFHTIIDSGSTTAVTQATAGNLNATVVGTGTFAVQAAATAALNSFADGSIVTLGAKADAKSTATDTTSITIMQVLKEISAMEQAPATRAVTNAGTFATQSAITAASGSIASGAIASGAIASGAVASGAYASGSISDGAEVTLGAKADAKSTATDTTSITVMQVLKEISAMEQAPASRAVTNAGTFATQSAITAASGSIASGAIASGAIASGAIASGAVASGAYASGSISDGAEVTLGAKADAKSTATDTTSITIMQVLKEISAMAQAPAALPSNQSTNVAQINGVTPLMGNGVTGTGSPRVTISSDNTAFSVNAQPTPVTTGGLSWYNVEPGASDNHVVIKAGAGQVYTIHTFSKHTAVQFIRLYNATTGFNGCNSATNLVWEGQIPGNAAGAGFVTDISLGIAFATGISICVTGAYGQTDTTAATASVMAVGVGYK